MTDIEKNDFLNEIIQKIKNEVNWDALQHEFSIDPNNTVSERFIAIEEVLEVIKSFISKPTNITTDNIEDTSVNTLPQDIEDDIDWEDTVTGNIIDNDFEEI